MSETTLSSDLIEITAEINSYKQIAGQAVFEIGKRLKHVKENDLVHGQWEGWCKQQLNFTSRQANKYIRVYDRFSNRNLGSDFGLKKLDMLAEFDDEELDTSVQLASGEEKKLGEMSIREIDQYKREKAEAERRAKEAEERAARAEATAETERNSARHFERLWDQAKRQPARVETKTIEKVPEDYHLLKQQASKVTELSTENIKLQRAIGEQRERYEQQLTQEDRRKAINKDLKKYCTELLQQHAMYTESIIYNLSLNMGEREASQLIDSFQIQYSHDVQVFMTKIKQMTTVRTVS